MDDEVPLDAVRNAVLIEHADGRRDLALDFVRAHGASSSLIVPITQGPRDRGARLLNRLCAHGIPVRVTMRT